MHGILGRRHREEKMRDAERGAMKRADEESRFVLPSVLTFFGWKIIGFEYFGGILYLSIYIHYRIYQSYLFPSPNYHVWDNINQHYVPLHSWTLLNRVIYNRCLLHGSMKVNRCLALPKPRGLSARDILFEYSMCFLCFDSIWFWLLLSVCPFLDLVFLLSCLLT